MLTPEYIADLMNTEVRLATQLDTENKAAAIYMVQIHANMEARGAKDVDEFLAWMDPQTKEVLLLGSLMQARGANESAQAMFDEFNKSQGRG